MKTLLLTGVAVLLAGCASYVYKGEITAPDSAGKDRRIILWWPKTEPLVGPAKAGPASLLTECGVPIRYDERERAILFRGVPGQDRRPGEPGPSRDDLVCGEFRGHTRFTEIPDGPLSVTVRCEPVNGEFSALPRTYIAARTEPYTFPVASRKRWSLLGRTPDAPPPPRCRE